MISYRHIVNCFFSPVELVIFDFNISSAKEVKKGRGVGNFPLTNSFDETARRLHWL